MRVAPKSSSSWSSDTAARRLERRPAGIGRRRGAAICGIGAALALIDIVEIGIESGEPLLGTGAILHGAGDVTLLDLIGRLLRLALLVALKQRVPLELALDESLQLEIGHLQKLDRLLQLRRHDQGLALLQL